jgi:hypothetical protein
MTFLTFNLWPEFDRRVALKYQILFEEPESPKDKMNIEHRYIFFPKFTKSQHPRGLVPKWLPMSLLWCILQVGQGLRQPATRSPHSLSKNTKWALGLCCFSHAFPGPASLGISQDWAETELHLDSEFYYLLALVDFWGLALHELFNLTFFKTEAPYLLKLFWIESIPASLRLWGTKSCFCKISTALLHGKPRTW